MNNHEKTRTELAEALDYARIWLSRFVTMPDPGDLDICTLWIAHTWAMDQTATTPRLLIDSATHGSGKTTLLEHTNALSFEPLMAASLSSPALMTRMLAQGPRTILIDEADRTLNPNNDNTGELLAVINSGYKRGATRPVLVPGEGGQWEPKELPTYSAVAIAGNAPALPEDTRSRCIRILLMPDFLGRAEDSDWEEIEPESVELRDAIATTVEQATDRIAVKPALPEGCRGRMAEKWRPLARIAHAAGGLWVERLNAAIAKDMDEIEQEREDGMTQERPAIVLLRHLAQVWPEGQQFVPTSRLIESLVATEPEMWGEASPYGKRLTSQRMGRMLSQAFKIHSGKLNGVRGYRASRFDSMWRQFGLTPPNETAHSVRTVQTVHALDDSDSPGGISGSGQALDGGTLLDSSDGSDGSDGLDGRGKGYSGNRQCAHRHCQYPAETPGGLCKHHVRLKAQMDKHLPDRRLCARAGCGKQAQGKGSFCWEHISKGLVGNGLATDQSGEKVLL